MVDDLKSMNKAALYEHAKRANIAGRSKMNKEQLIDALSKKPKQQNPKPPKLTNTILTVDVSDMMRNIHHIYTVLASIFKPDVEKKRITEIQAINIQYYVNPIMRIRLEFETAIDLERMEFVITNTVLNKFAYGKIYSGVLENEKRFNANIAEVAKPIPLKVFRSLSTEQPYGRMKRPVVKLLYTKTDNPKRMMQLLQQFEKRNQLPESYGPVMQVPKEKWDNDAWNDRF